MMLRHVAALVRAQARTFASYRFGALTSILAMLATVVPLWFVARALQPVVENSIRAEGGEYFGFLITGIGFSFVVTAALGTLPGAVSSGIRSGTLETLFCTPASTPAILLGLSGFDLLMASARLLLLLVVLTVAGTTVHWSGLPWAILAVALTACAYGAIGLVLATLILLFRTSGPLQSAILTGSALLGGVYYSTTVIPEPFDALAVVVPMTWGLRMARVSLLEGAGLHAVLEQCLPLAALTAVLLVIGVVSFRYALGRSRHTGTLAQY